MVALLAGAWVSAALAKDAHSPPPRDRLHYTHTTFAQVNPLDLVEQFRIGWRRRLSTSDASLLRDTHAFLAGNVMVTPGSARIGAYGEAQVLSFLRLFGGLDGVGYFGTFRQVLSDPQTTFSYSPEDQERRAERPGNYATTGWVLTLGGTLQASAGPVVVRSTAQLASYQLELQPAWNRVFYDRSWDRLAINGGWMIRDDTDLLVVLDGPRVGLRHTFSRGLELGQTRRAFWSCTGNQELWESAEASYPSGEAYTTPAGCIPHHRVGPMFAWRFVDKGPSFTQPTVFVLVQWWLQHPYRTGPLGAVPLISVGLAFNGDLATRG